MHQTQVLSFANCNKHVIIYWDIMLGNNGVFLPHRMPLVSGPIFSSSLQYSSSFFQSNSSWKTPSGCRLMGAGITNPYRLLFLENLEIYFWKIHPPIPTQCSSKENQRKIANIKWVIPVDYKNLDFNLSSLILQIITSVSSHLYRS